MLNTLQKHLFSPLLLALFLGLALQPMARGNAFLCDVHLNGANAPSLTFGQGQAEASLLPAPPFSAMFGVADTFLVHRNPAAAPTPDYLRLSQDITHAVVDGNRWVIACGLYTETLTFNKHPNSSDFPNSLYIVWPGQNGQQLEQQQLTAGLVFAAEPGKAYTIVYAPQNDPADSYFAHDHDTLAADRNANPLAVSKTLTLPADANAAVLTVECIDLAQYPELPDVDSAGAPAWKLTLAAGATLPFSYEIISSIDPAVKRFRVTFTPALAAGSEVTVTMTASSSNSGPVATQIGVNGAPAFRQLAWLVDQTSGNFSFVTLANSKITFRENLHSEANPRLIDPLDPALFSARLRASAAADWQATTAVIFSAAGLNDPDAGTASVTAAGKISFAPAAGYVGTVTLAYTARQTLSPFAEMTGNIDIEILENKLFQVLDGRTLTFAKGKYTALKPLLLKSTDTKLFECQVRANENAPWVKFTQVTFTQVTPIPPECGTVALTNGNLTYFPAPFYQGSFDLQATLSKDAENSASGTLTITVTPVNTLPIVSDITPITAIEGEPVEFSCIITDPDSTPPVVDIAGMKLGSFSGFVATGPAQPVPDSDISWLYTFRGTTPLPFTAIKHANTATALKLTFKVSDGSGKSTSVKGEITVTDVDQPPVLSSITVNKKKDQREFYNAALGDLFTAAAKVSDPDKDKPVGITYIWECDGNPDKIHVGETLSTALPELDETWRLFLEVLTAPYKAEIVSHRVGTGVIVQFGQNTPPVFMDDPNSRLFLAFGAAPAPLAYLLPLHDRENEPLNVTLVAPFPVKGTAELNGRTLTYTVTDPLVPFSQDTADSVTVRVSDGTNAVQKTYTISYCENAVPVLAPLAPLVIAEMKGKKAGSFTVKATATDAAAHGEASGIVTVFCQVLDAQGELLGTWQLPAGKEFKQVAKASFSGKVTLPGFNTITGAARPAQADFTVRVTAVDILGASTSADMIVTVQDSDALPAAAVGVNFTPAVPYGGDALSAQALGPETDADGDPIDYQYVWTCSSRKGESWEGAQLGTAISKGEKWTCTVYPVTRPPYQGAPYLRTDKKMVPPKAFTVTVANTPPVGANATLEIAANTTSNLALPGIADADADDAGKLSIVITSKPAAGKTGKIAGNVIPYTPTAGYTGIDTFTYQVKDKSKGISPIYTVTLYIGVPAPPAPAPPAAVPSRADGFSAPALTAGPVQLPWYPEITLSIPGYSREALLVRILAGAEVIMETLVPRGDNGTYALTAAAYYQAGCTGLRPGATYAVKGYSWSDETGIGMERIEQPLTVSSYAAPAHAAIDILAPADGEPFHTLLLALPGANTYTLTLERDGAPWLQLERDVRPGDGQSERDRLDLALPAGFYTLTLTSRNPAGALAEPLELDCLSTDAAAADGQWPEAGFYPTGAVQSATLALPPFSWPALSAAVGYRLQVCRADGVVLYEGITTATSGIPVMLQQPLPAGSTWQVTAFDAEGGTSLSRPVPIE